MTWAYYNEFDAYAAAWLRNLIAAGHIPAGEVDERDIREVTGDDLKGYGQCHFFAGLGGWAYAARLAGISDHEPIWTGSVPCQPLSSAGQRKGHADERHLWPAFYRLIAERRPATVFGEQVASKLGREWLSGVRADLEHLGYAVGAADLPAAGVGAPQIRQRLWWVADAGSQRRQQDAQGALGHESEDGREQDGDYKPTSDGPTGGLADAGHPERRTRGRPRDLEGRNALRREGEEGPVEPGERSPARGLGVSGGAGSQAREREALCGTGRGQEGRAALQPGGPSNFWDAFDLIPCADGKARRVEPGTSPLAHGVPARVGQLRAYGNAIVPQVAAKFMRAAREIAP